MIAGRYTLDRELGRGGMGAVWLATDRVLGRRVALKQLTPVAAGGAPTARAEREARLAARLSHPNVVAVFDLVTENERPWLVMEYVEGTNLASFVAEHGPLSPDDAAALLVQVAGGLLAAHKAGIVHRDVKPSNILVTAAGRAKLTDFGVARGNDLDATLTQAGLVTGSPAYIAPEVAAGRPATPASDVWSLGATLFHAVTGRPPYDIGDNVLGALYRIVHEEPPRTDRAGWLTPMLTGAMTQDPRQRWSMAGVDAFLKRRGGQTQELMAPPAPTVSVPAVIGAEPATPGRRSRRLTPMLLGALGLIAIGVIGALGALLLHDDSGSPQHRAQASAPIHPASRGTSTDAATGGPDAASGGPNAATGGPDAAGVRGFVTDYLQTAAGDPPRGFAMLTPSFQDHSGGLAGYESFWGNVSSIDSVQRIDPEVHGNDLRVAYTYTYTYADGRQRTESVHLRLVYDQGRYLIAGD